MMDCDRWLVMMGMRNTSLSLYDKSRGACKKS